MERGWRSGARFPRKPIYGPRLDEPPYDPTNGGCFGCGEKAGVMTFGLVFVGRPAGIWRLCEPCYLWGNRRDPRDADPLSA